MYELYDSSLFVEPVIFIYIHVVFVRVQFKLNNVTNPRRRRSVNKKDNSASKGQNSINVVKPNNDKENC